MARNNSKRPVRHQDIKKALKKPSAKGKREGAPERYQRMHTLAREQLAERFVTEYLRDFNAGAAYTRALGFEEVEARALSWKTLQNMGYHMKHDPVVANKIETALQLLKEEEIVNRKEILMGLKREANYDGYDSMHGARVTAWTQLGKFIGMDTKRVEVNLASQGGVLVVPASQNVDDWEKRSAEAQRALKESVRK